MMPIVPFLIYKFYTTHLIKQEVKTMHYSVAHILNALTLLFLNISIVSHSPPQRMELAYEI